MVLPSAVFGQNAPSNRITIGCVGLGGMGMQNLKGFLNQSGTQIVALCDVDQNYLVQGLQEANLPDACGYTDFRQVVLRDDIDVIVNTTPDHWHAPISLAAVKAGKDVYCEKPLTHNIQEGRDLADAVKRYGRVFQVGSQQRSDDRFRRACELFRNGRIGKIEKIIVEIPENSRQYPLDRWPVEPVPEELDYNLWLGPAPWAPYTTQRCHYSFRFILDYSGGQLTNWGAHHLDIVQWALGMDQSGPVEIQGTGVFPQDGLFDTALKYDIVYTYANGVQVYCITGRNGGHIRFVGSKGVIDVNRESLKARPESILKSTIAPDEIHLQRNNDHRKNFLECVKSRKQPIAPAETGHRTATMCHLGNIAMRLGRKLNWNPITEMFESDDEANCMKSRPMRLWMK